MKVMTSKLSHHRQANAAGQFGLGLFLKLYTGQMIVAVMYINTANTLPTIRILSNGNKTTRRAIVKMMTSRVKMKQTEYTATHHWSPG